MGTCRRALVIIGLLLAMTSPAQAQGELFRCKQADGTIKFSDHGGPGCKKGEFKADIQVLEREQAPAKSQPAIPLSDKPASAPAAAPRVTVKLSSDAFPAATRSVPALAFHDLSSEQKAKGLSIPNKGDIHFNQLSVSHLAAGNGPKFAADEHFRGDGRDALVMATLAVAKALQYDPRYLQVTMTMPVSVMNRQVHVSGPSAGVVLAVAVASAILGDPIRPDVCMTGTMDPSLKVGSVGGLEDKIDGCHMLRDFRELLLPVGQNNFTIKDKGSSYGIKVTEVATLAEAYEIATGRELRPFQQR